MKTLNALWVTVGKSEEKKFRYIDWNHNTKYFQVRGLSDDGKHFIGVLDCGTKAFFPVDSDFWEEYNDGDEHSARAV